MCRNARIYIYIYFSQARSIEWAKEPKIEQKRDRKKNARTQFACLFHYVSIFLVCFILAECDRYECEHWALSRAWLCRLISSVPDWATKLNVRKKVKTFDWSGWHANCAAEFDRVFEFQRRLESSRQMESDTFKLVAPFCLEDNNERNVHCRAKVHHNLSVSLFYSTISVAWVKSRKRGWRMHKKHAINSIICSCHRRQYHCMYQCSSSPTLKQIAIVAFFFEIIESNRIRVSLDAPQTQTVNCVQQTAVASRNSGQLDQQAPFVFLLCLPLSFLLNHFFTVI